MTPRRTNGSSVTRAELGAHLERIDGQLASLHRKVDDIADAIKAPQRWFWQRVGHVVDRAIVAGVAAVLAYVAFHA